MFVLSLVIKQKTWRQSIARSLHRSHQLRIEIQQTYNTLKNGYANIR
jgi:hypothetical protein